MRLAQGIAVAVCGVSVTVFGLILTQFVGLSGFGVLVGLGGIVMSFVGAVIEADRDRLAIPGEEGPQGPEPHIGRND